MYMHIRTYVRTYIRTHVRTYQGTILKYCTHASWKIIAKRAPIYENAGCSKQCSLFVSTQLLYRTVFKTYGGQIGMHLIN